MHVRTQLDTPSRGVFEGRGVSADVGSQIEVGDLVVLNDMSDCHGGFAIHSETILQEYTDVNRITSKQIEKHT